MPRSAASWQIEGRCAPGGTAPAAIMVAICSDEFKGIHDATRGSNIMQPDRPQIPPVVILGGNNVLGDNNGNFSGRDIRDPRAALLVSQDRQRALGAAQVGSPGRKEGPRR